MIFIPKNFSDNSKVWVYQSDRKLNSKEVTHLKEQVQNFVQNWISHNNQLKAFGDIYLDQIKVKIESLRKNIGSDRRCIVLL